MTRPKAWLAWSTGKDSAWSLHVIRRQDEVEVVALLTTLNEAYGRVAMHGVRESLLNAQAASIGLPVVKVPLPDVCVNDEYDRRMTAAMAQARSEDVSHVIFGDLFLEDIRAYRESRLAGTGITPLFPLWGLNTASLAREMTSSGLRAVVTCIDTKQLAAAFSGRHYDASLLADLPPAVDPCGERGEFHTFVLAGPMFRTPIPVLTGEQVHRNGFFFTDLLPATSHSLSAVK